MALPLLTTAARTAPASTSSRQTRIGAAAEALRVRTIAEATSSASQTTMPTSVLPAALETAVGAAGAEARGELGGIELLDALGRVDPARTEERGGCRLAHLSPSVSSSPSIRLRFCTPWLEAPFQMLSIAEKAITLPRSSTVT